jgi:hypothetical protein
MGENAEIGAVNRGKLPDVAVVQQMLIQMMQVRRNTQVVDSGQGATVLI